MLIRRLLPVRHRGAFVALYLGLRVVVAFIEARLFGPPKVAWVIAGSIVILIGVRLLARALGWYDAKVDPVPPLAAQPTAAPVTAPIADPPVAPTTTSPPATTPAPRPASPRAATDRAFPVPAAVVRAPRPSFVRQLPEWSPPPNPFATAAQGPED